MASQDLADRLIAQWRDILARGCSYDAWGQIIEASKEYSKVSEEVKEQLVSPEMPFNERLALFVNKTAVAASMRAKALDDLNPDGGSVTLSQMQALVEALKTISVDILPFPIEGIIEIKSLQVQAPAPSQRSSKRISVDVEDDEDDEEDVRGGTLLSRPRLGPGKSNITIRIERIQIKDATSFIEPFFTIWTKDALGKDIAAPQDTPPTNQKDEFVHFNTNVDIQLPLEEFPEDGAIFLEFKHYKPKKHKNSVKCFCILEKDELKTGSFPLEIYSKPTDFKRKKLQLLTDKPHYLHVSITITPN